MELLLNRKTTLGVTRYLVLWRGHTSAADEWLRAEELLHCPEKVAEYDAAAPRRRRAGRRVPPAGAAVVSAGVDPLPSVRAVPLLVPAGSRLATLGEVRTGAGGAGGPVDPVPLAFPWLGSGQGGPAAGLPGSPKWSATPGGRPSARWRRPPCWTPSRMALLVGG